MALIFQNNLVVTRPAIVSIACAEDRLIVVVRNDHSTTATVEFADNPNFLFSESISLASGASSSPIDYGPTQNGTSETIYARAIASGGTSAVRTRTQTVYCLIQLG
jgi:hypothetical protein